MSANNTGDVRIHTAGGYNFYTVNSDGKKIIIGGVPEKYSEQYIKTAADSDVAVLLTSKPEFTGGLDTVLDINPGIEIYGGSACLRNIKEIVNRRINEKLIKDNMTVHGMKFIITPNLDWVDTVMALKDGILFSGQTFSGNGDSEEGLEVYFKNRLAVNKAFVVSALERLENEDIKLIYPAFGKICHEDVFNKYRKWAESAVRDRKRAVVIYSSEYGYTKLLAEYTANKLSDVYDTALYDVKDTDAAKMVNDINSADILAIGTNTINRNAPRGIWDVITKLDLVNKRGMLYFVFGSFGWAGDGIKLVDKTLAAMGMCRAAKPAEVLFKPSDKDFERIDKVIEKVSDKEKKSQ